VRGQRLLARAVSSTSSHGRAAPERILMNRRCDPWNGGTIEQTSTTSAEVLG
jgi:hypothetical protein